MGTKKKKNSNYVTEKTELAKREKLKAEKRKQTTKLALIIAAAVLAAAILVGAVIGIVHAVRNNVSFDFEVTHHASIVIEGYGTLHVELYGEEAPKTVENFVNLAYQGYYNGTSFHKIIKDFTIQGGEISQETSTIVGEFETNGYENNVPFARGVIAMARDASDYDSARSQFFIVTDTENADSFNGNYAAFGRVTGGMSIIDEICDNARPTDNYGSILPNDQPIISSISIHAAH